MNNKIKSFEEKKIIIIIYKYIIKIYKDTK